MYICMHMCRQVDITMCIDAHRHICIYPHTYKCTCVYMCMCRFVDMYMCIHTYMHDCIYPHASKCTCMYTYMCRFVYVYIYTYIRRCTHVFMYIYIYMYVYMYICVRVYLYFLCLWKMRVLNLCKKTTLQTLPFSVSGLTSSHEDADFARNNYSFRAATQIVEETSPPCCYDPLWLSPISLSSSETWGRTVGSLHQYSKEEDIVPEQRKETIIGVVDTMAATRPH